MINISGEKFKIFVEETGNWSKIYDRNVAEISLVNKDGEEKIYIREDLIDPSKDLISRKKVLDAIAPYAFNPMPDTAEMIIPVSVIDAKVRFAPSYFESENPEQDLLDEDQKKVIECRPMEEDCGAWLRVNGDLETFTCSNCLKVSYADENEMMDRRFCPYCGKSMSYIQIRGYSSN